MTKEESFVNELIGYIFAYPNDDYMTMECLCRKLYKYGLIDKKDGEWTCNFIEKADTPQTDSTGSPIGDYRDGVGAWQTDCGWGKANE
jgi:hypothetical protein